MAISRTVEADGLPVPQRYWAFAAVLVSLVLAVMDASVANVALPTISHDMHATPTDSIAVVSAYQLAIVVLLLPVASLGDIFGYRRVYVYGLSLFTIASIACVFSTSITMLTIARVFQGFGATGIMAVNSALTRYIFPQKMIGRAIGANATVTALAATVGPSFAGLVLSIASWQWLFAVNIPLGIISVGLGLRFLPYSRLSGNRFDIISAILTATMFGALISGIDSFTHSTSWVLRTSIFALGIAAAIGSIARQLNRTAPLLPVDLFRRTIFTLSICTSITSFIAQMASFVALPFFFEIRLGFQPTEVGLLIMPWPLGVALSTTISGRMADRYPAAILNCAGLSVVAFGMVCLGLLPAHPGAADVVWRMAVTGLGFGFFQPPNNRTIISSAPKDRSGAANGMLATARLLGQATGATLVALMLAHFPIDGARWSLFVGSGFAALGAAVSLLRLV